MSYRLKLECPPKKFYENKNFNNELNVNITDKTDEQFIEYIKNNIDNITNNTSILKEDIVSVLDDSYPNILNNFSAYTGIIFTWNNLPMTRITFNDVENYRYLIVPTMEYRNNKEHEQNIRILKRWGIGFLAGLAILGGVGLYYLLKDD